MIRVIILAALLMTGLNPAIAQDNNPFSGATSISVEMRREGINSKANNGSHKLRVLRAERINRPFRLHCALDGRPMADWRGNAIRFKGDVGWATVPPDAAGPMMVLLWAGGARCK